MKNEELMVLAAAAIAVWMIVRKTGTGAGFVAPAYVRKTGELNGITTYSNGVMIDESGVYYDAQGNAVWAPGMF